ncbi:hypothetical protein SAMD00019534_086460, partial [Acytostelium subglobosum LB1]|uniref:hypothetical protein n=1 Tax=Acytostelium subglobosum LB1 TaxID=1410327 RepID=UPI000644B5F1
MQSNNNIYKSTTMLSEGPAKLLDIINGMAKTRALYTAAKLNVAHAIPIDGKRSSDEIANEVGCDKSALYRLLRALTQIGVFHECEDQDGVFEHNSASLGLLQENLRDYVLFNGQSATYRAWEVLPVSIETGTSSLSKALDGLEFFDYLETRPEEALVFGRAMTAITTKMAPHLVARTDFSGFDTVADLGGSEGILLNAVLKANPSIKTGINFDLPNLIAKYQALPSRQASLDPRFKDVGGSFFDSVPQADLYMLKNILHDWNDESVINIFKTIIKSMKPSSKIYVFDYLVGNEKNENQTTVVWMDLKMLNFNNGKERTVKDWQEIAKQTGLTVERVETSPMVPALIVFRK